MGNYLITGAASGIGQATADLFSGRGHLIYALDIHAVFPKEHLIPITADITMESVKELGLAEGKECYAVIKATNVMFATEKIAGISARNQIEGTVVALQEGAVNGHVTIEDEYGVRVSGSITNEAIEALELAEGKKAVAIVKATDVMVAVD